MAEMHIVIDSDEWNKLNGALIYTEITDRREGRSHMADDINAIRRKVEQQAAKRYTVEREQPFTYVVVTPLGDVVSRNQAGHPLTKQMAHDFANAVNASYKPEYATATVFELIAVAE